MKNQKKMIFTKITKIKKKVIGKVFSDGLPDFYDFFIVNDLVLEVLTIDSKSVRKKLAKSMVKTETCRQKLDFGKYFVF